jgi:Kazal-type serine protease inhibitor domain
MIIACAAVLAVVVASASPLSAAPTSQAFEAAGTVTAQIEPKDSGARRPTVCTEQYAPVCGRANGVLKTYSNQCFARADGADLVAQGPCTNSATQPVPR